MEKTFKEKLQTDIILLDGAFGTYAQELGLGDEHFGSKHGCMEYLSIQSPDFVSRIHNDYLEAGSDAIETNTFGANSIKLAEYGLGNKVYEINLASTKLARKCADKFSDKGLEKYVVGTMGPTGKLPSSSDPILGDITYDELKKIYCEQALGILDGDADAILIETGQDILEMKAAVNGAKEAMHKKKKDIAIIAQCTLSNNGRMLLGAEVGAVIAALSDIGIDALGLNCSTGPLEMENSLRLLSENSPSFVSCVPNAGMPVEKNGEVSYPLSPSEMAELLQGFLKKYRINIIGGCCGTGPEHIRSMRKILTAPSKKISNNKTFMGNHYKAFDTSEAKRPIIVGERINTQGSRKMKELLTGKDYDGIVELGKLQQQQGADILDVCGVLTERNTEEQDAVTLFRHLGESVQIPLMVDSTDIDVIRSVLEVYPGTAVINSVNLEDGGKRAKRIFALAKEHGSFVVCLTIDEKGMAKEVSEKVDVAERLYGLAAGECGIPPSKLIFDMLTFTLGTGENGYKESALNTCEAIRKFKKKHPEVLTTLGVSNVSFGLPPASRKILNMTFLGNAVKCGLDMAIVNPAEYLGYEDIPIEERKVAEDLIFNKGGDVLEKFVRYFSEKGSVSSEQKVSCDDKSLGIEDRLKKCVFDRNKKRIIPLLDEAMKNSSAEEIMNNILMEAMKEVGERLETGEMVLPYVLQSAEVMKKAIDHLEKFISHASGKKRGKILLATVFGDVHDIGKNLVRMILENNGFSVIDLGKQVPIERIVKEAKKHKVDAVGLSALLVSTARHMRTCVQAMHEAGLDYPVLIGGAPTNKHFAKNIASLSDNSMYSGGVFYAKDAFSGLAIVQALMDTENKQKLMQEYKESVQSGEEDVRDKPKDIKAKSVTKESTSTDCVSLPIPPFFGTRSLKNIPADDVFEHLDKRMLFDLAWGVKIKDEGAKRIFIEEECEPMLKELKEEALRKGWLDLKAVYGYFRTRKENGKLFVSDDEGKDLYAMNFGTSDKAMKLNDYFSDKDIAAFQAVTVGGEIGKAIEELNEQKEYSRAFFLHGLSVHLAEALASYIHDRIRGEWGLKVGQGKRYSPGYPLWKDLSEQVKVFGILEAEKSIGLELTEGYQIIPEQSTTAMIIHNDKAE
ncbi:MAG: homocysteine S-methyltransferase family protein [Candidatus Aadella gelida]|nr:homocysteine S-methyltransferase family protein [Candidatus Aadella gelida]